MGKPNCGMFRPSSEAGMSETRMSIAAVSSIPSTIPSLNPIEPVAQPAAPKAEDKPAEKVRPTPPSGVGEKVDVEA